MTKIGQRISKDNFTVYETEDYNQIFCKEEAITEQTYQVHLFKVVREDEKVVFVICKNKEDAISQATCEFEFEAGIRKTAVAYEIPFRIRGWSKIEF